MSKYLDVFSYTEIDAEFFSLFFSQDEPPWFNDQFFRQGWEQVKLRMEQLQVAKQKLQDWLKSTGRWG